MAKQYASKGDGDSPLATRRGNADPIDIDDSPLNLDFGERSYDHDPLKPEGPIEPGGAVPPQEAPTGGN